MKTDRVQEVLQKIKEVKVAVYGDFCLDAYWMLNTRGGEISVETGLQTQAVGRQYYSLGGASNIVANLAALRPAAIYAVGVVGDDIFGRELLRQLQALRVDTCSIVVQEDHFDTVTFAKRYLEDQEQQRIDFGFFNQRSEDSEQALLSGLEHALQNDYTLIFNQQVPGSLDNDGFIENVNGLFARFSDKIVLLDSRHYAGRFENTYRKTNDVEAALLNGVAVELTDTISAHDAETYARQLHERSGKPVFLTRGPRGILVVDKNELRSVPGIQTLKKVDTVGAGDTTLSGLSLALAAGLSPAEAAEFANLAAAVTVQKLFRTGTASGDEILEICDGANYICQPELAEDMRQARMIDDKEIEVCCDLSSLCLGNIKHAVFDHDGTVSTLRQGWEAIMEPFMVKAILGDHYQAADETLFQKTLGRVRDYIDKSTGIQTILQMEALVEMVHEYGLVPAEQVLDKFGYKEIYNRALLKVVDERLVKFESGQLELNDFIVKGSIEFLKMLRDRHVTLYLASGTDREDVIREAGVMGYADLFDGGIYGALGDVRQFSKKAVIENIMRQNNLQGNELAVFGDGPVEMQEARRYDGIAIGVASDEIRRHGLNPEKRTRLIKAGAHLIVPDFSRGKDMMAVCFPR
jgi:rfaE bifunctional protein kinase chain/domain